MGWDYEPNVRGGLGGCVGYKRAPPLMTPPFPRSERLFLRILVALLLVDPRVGTTDRESRSARLDRFLSHLRTLGVKATEARPQLEFGDFCFTGNGPDGPVLVGIEYKKLRDLVNNIRTGGYAGHQLPGMLDTYDINYLFVEGYWRCGGSGELEEFCMRGKQRVWSPVRLGRSTFLHKSFNAFITSTEMVGVKYRRCSNEDDTLLQVADTYRSWSKEWDEHTTHAAFTMDPNRVDVLRPSLVRRWAKELTKVGWKRSRQLLDHFDSGYEMAHCSMGRWKSIAKEIGMGEKQAERIFREIRGM